MAKSPGQARLDQRIAQMPLVGRFRKGLALRMVARGEVRFHLEDLGGMGVRLVECVHLGMTRREIGVVRQPGSGDSLERLDRLRVATDRDQPVHHHAMADERSRAARHRPGKRRSVRLAAQGCRLDQAVWPLDMDAASH